MARPTGRPRTMGDEVGTGWRGSGSKLQSWARPPTDPSSRDARGSWARLSPWSAGSPELVGIARSMLHCARGWLRRLGRCADRFPAGPHPRCHGCALYDPEWAPESFVHPAWMLGEEPLDVWVPDHVPQERAFGKDGAQPPDLAGVSGHDGGWADGPARSARGYTHTHKSRFPGTETMRDRQVVGKEAGDGPLPYAFHGRGSRGVAVPRGVIPVAIHGVSAGRGALNRNPRQRIGVSHVLRFEILARNVRG